ncbi:MAG: biotin/lipoyl-containing protein [Polyangiaceae bacterium]
MKYLVTVGSSECEVDVERRADGSYLVHDENGAPLEVQATTDARQPDLQSLLVDGQSVDVQPADAEIHFRQERYSVRAQNVRDRAATQASTTDSAQARQVLASMPGRVVRVLCEAGASVVQGAPLIVIEAMKMQNELCAKADAVVRAVHVTPGQTVERGAVLVDFV